MQTTIIEATHITKVYRLYAEDIYAVNGVDLAVKEGDFIAIMGPSGSGKTTMLDILGCLDSITEGTLIVNGHDVSRVPEHRLVNVRRGTIGFVFQDFSLIPSLTALENVTLALGLAHKKSTNSIARAMLAKVGLGHRVNHLPKQMSGGEKQRVAIARALAVEPKILFADEPTGNLDTKTSLEIMALFQQLNDEGLTIVLTTHDRSLGEKAKEIVYIQDGKITSAQDVRL